MTSPSKLLSPESSPDVVSRNAGVRRVNNLPLYIFGGHHADIYAADGYCCDESCYRS